MSGVGRLLGEFLGRSSMRDRSIKVVLDPDLCDAETACKWQLIEVANHAAEFDNLEALGDGTFKLTHCSACGCDQGLCIEVRPKRLGNHDASSENAVAGFYYRVPGSVELAVYELRGGNKKTLSTGHLPIAQYGQIRGLPRRFGTLKSSIERLELDPLTGAIVTISVNGKSLGREDVERIANYDVELEERRISALQREKQTLELRKAIRELAEGESEDN